VGWKGSAKSLTLRKEKRTGVSFSGIFGLVGSWAVKVLWGEVAAKEVKRVFLGVGPRKRGQKILKIEKIRGKEATGKGRRNQKRKLVQMIRGP